jgi:hypothetical protein
LNAWVPQEELPGDGTLTIGKFLTVIAEKKFPTIDKRGYEDKPTVTYYNIPAAFDIETSSFYDGDPEEPENKRAIMYMWQFGIGSYVTIGRTWDEYIMLMLSLTAILQLNKEKRLAVYVHNLSYEFGFMHKRFNWDEVFILESRKPTIALNGGIEYRDMLKLSGGKKLANITNDLQKYKVKKMVGDLDYSKIRHSKTPLTDKEMKYGENDIRVCLCYIQEKIEQDGGIAKIPMTNTGYVRRYCRNKCRKRWMKYRKLMNQLQLNPKEYMMLRDGFMGGFTHANFHYVNKVLKLVASYDLTSSYPSVMVLEKFPMAKGEFQWGPLTLDEVETWFDTHCCLMHLQIETLVPKLVQDFPISSSKCLKIEGETVDNGRVVSARYLEIICTELDLDTYKTFYDWNDLVVTEMITYEKGFLPKVFVEAILDLYVPKTKLKGIAEKALEYMISKNMLNAAYGMSVTNPLRDIFTYEEWGEPPTKPDMKEAIKTYNEDMKRFLFFPWGVWVTAYARHNLFEAIVALGNDYVYADTDSVKFINYERHKQLFDDSNDRIIEKIEFVAEKRNIPVEKFMPKNDVKNKIYPIGQWSFEGVYDKFKTLGAKRYFVLVDGKYELTVAGANKAMACKYLTLKRNKDPFDMFADGLCVPAEYSGRNILTYIDCETEGVVYDYLGEPLEYHEYTSIHMEASDYNMSMSADFRDFLRDAVEASY